MHAFLAAGFQHGYTSTIQLYGWALEILDRGRLIWSDVPAEIRGVVFEDTFIRGIRHQRNNTYMEVSAFSDPPTLTRSWLLWL